MRRAARNASLRRRADQCRYFYAVAATAEALTPPSPDRSSPTRRTSRRERSSSIRVVIFSTSSMTLDKPFRYGVGVGAEGFIWSGRATVL